MPAQGDMLPKAIHRGVAGVSVGGAGPAAAGGTSGLGLLAPSLCNPFLK
jgi:hypothetical protein